MTSLLPDGIASWLGRNDLSFLSEIIGAICVPLLLALLILREAQRARHRDAGSDQKLRALDATTAPLIIVVATIIIERFLLFK